MKRIGLYCVISAAIGAAAAAVLFRSTGLEGVSGAQEAALLPGSGGEEPKGAAGPALPAAPLPLGAQDYTPDERVNIQVYDDANRGVVNITTKGFQGERFLLIEIPSQGEGSGVVLDRQGHVLTNFHVVDGARQIQVTLFDGTTYPARLVGQDPATDVAVVRIEAPPQSLYPVKLGTSTNLRVGQRVFAIGNPFGLERTLTTGIISSLDRSLPSRSGRSLKSIIQIDAAINPGNSGGPLLDSHSRMIGMNTAIASRTGESAGVGFAIPVNTIARIVPQLVANGKVRRPDVGISRVYQTEQGLLVATLAPGGPAEKAGLHGPRVVRQQKRQGPFVYEYQTVDRSAADLIVAVDGKPIKTADEFLDAIESKQPGEQVVLSVVRAGQPRQVPVQLAAGE
ncbi:MAG: trypsin-like peptidase domain-containing protein [Thermoguttaceae bacterium]